MYAGKVPFVANSDNLHCLQACLRSALVAIPPNRDFTMQQLEAMTGFEPGKLTWPMKAYVEVYKLGYSVVVYDPMDFESFIENPYQYMIEAFGADIAQLYVRETNINAAVKDSLGLLKSGVKVHCAIPEYENLTELCKQEYLAICHIDQNILTGNEGNGDHFVLVMEADASGVLAHNPGPPAEANQHMPLELFDRAWSSPTKDARSVFAIGERRSG